MADKKDTPQDTPTTERKGGTLSVGGTLSAKGKSSGGGGGVSVEVRKRRFTQPSSANRTGAAAEAPLDEETSRRQQILEEARRNRELDEQRREEERRRANDLSKLKAEEREEFKRKQEEEARRRAEEEARKALEEAERQRATESAPQSASKGDAPRKTLTLGEEFSRAKRGKPAEKAATGSRKRGGRNAYMEDLETRYRTIGTAARRKTQRGRRPSRDDDRQAEKIIHEVAIGDVITVQELANAMAEKVGDVIKKLMMMGQMVTQNQPIDRDTATLIVEEFGHNYKYVSENEIEEGLVDDADPEGTRQTRPPIVTVMGHVDHGKTSLLDAIRHSDVVKGEAGGITQHMGAYQVTTKSGRAITFLDTPGHEAFTSMRARGASVTDVVILVVAADDGIMPQTIEAIRHAKAAEVPLVVAINKIDKPEANPDKVKQELLNHDLVPEEFGGDTVCVNVSAKTGMGLEELEEMVLLQADVLELQANPDRRADGVVVESRLDKGRGPVATVIVQRGTLRVGDIFVAGSVWGRVRALVDDTGHNVDSAGPAFPVEIIGLQGITEAGDHLIVVEDERRAREVADFRDRKKREKLHAASSAKMSLDNLFNRIAEGQVAKLSMVVKGDVQGSVEAINESLAKMGTDEVKVQVIHSAVGVITENDINLAAASDALVVGFNVRANAPAREAAEREGVEIRYYSVIYNLVDDVKAALVGLLSPEFEERITGHANVRDLFKFGKTKIAGCMVTQGVVKRGAKARIIRDGVVVHDGEISTLRRFKDEVKEVQENYECGMTFANFDDITAGDEVEAYEVVEVARTLDDLAKRGEKVQAEENTSSADASAGVSA